MLIHFLSLCISLKPIVIVPGFMSNHLMMSRDKKSDHWYCPSRIKNKKMFNRIQYMFPPLQSCFMGWLKLDYNKEIGSFMDYPYQNVSVYDFGDTEPFECFYSIYKGFGCIDRFQSVVKLLMEKGYIVQYNLFGASYDWRYGFTGQPGYFQQLKDLIEETRKRRNEKVIIIGHSMGCGVIQTFLNSFTTPKRREEHIDHVVYAAPSFVGVPMYVAAMWNLHFGQFKLSKEFADLLFSLPALLQHYPWDEVFKNETLLIIDGVHYNSTEAIKKIAEKHSNYKDFQFLLNKANEVMKYTRQDPGVHVDIIANGKIKTISGIEIIGNETKFLYTVGDTVISHHTADYACSTFKDVDCFDWKIPEKAYDHLGLLLKPDAREVLYKYISHNSTTKTSGNKFDNHDL